MSWKLLRQAHKQSPPQIRRDPEVSKVMGLALGALQDRETETKPQNWEETKELIRECMVQVLPETYAPFFDAVRDVLYETVDRAASAGPFVSVDDMPVVVPEEEPEWLLQ